jgi:hypothetical protein
VERIVVGGDGAYVIWRVSSVEGGAEGHGQVTYYRVQEGGWVHTWPTFDQSPAIECDQ